MPFPLAHPAAVLPLRRWCPRWFCFPALVVGSVVPDLGYLFGRFGDISHRVSGSFLFSLPVGLVVLWALDRISAPEFKLAPARFKRALGPLRIERPFSWFIIIASLLVGAWTHLLWDAFTHRNGWFVEHLPALQAPVFSLDHRQVRVCHFLWYGSSFAGLLWLMLAFSAKQPPPGAAPGCIPQKTAWRDAILVALLVLPIEIIHHLLRGPAGLVLVGLLSLLLVIGVALHLGSEEQTGRTTGREAPVPRAIDPPS